MEILQSAVLPAQVDADLLVLLAAGPTPVLELDSALGGRLGRLIGSEELKTDRGQSLLLHLAGEITAPRLIVVGIGAGVDVDAEALRTAGAEAARAGAGVGGTIAFALDPSLPLGLADQAAALAEGIVLATFDSARWKSRKQESRPFTRLLLLGGNDAAVAAAGRSTTIAGWVNTARLLVAAPPNEFTPAAVADEARGIAERLADVSVAVLEPDELAAQGFGGIAAVGGAAANGPRLVTLHYRPQAAKTGIRLGLVGKAVTFDSGGYFLKPSASIGVEKADMAGGAAVLAALGAIAELRLPLEVIAVIPAAENALGAGAYRPGDILTMASGRTVEISNPDAEGRLLLADALTHVQRLGATHLVDVATLTGAVIQALGDYYAGVFANDDSWRDAIIAAGETSGDRAWPLPLDPRYRSMVESQLADLRNSPAGSTRAVLLYSAYFIREFAGDGPWAHIDIAGMRLLTEARGYYRPGPTGYGVRLLVELATRLSGA